MQTSNFQLSFAVKPSSANSPSGLAPGGIGQGANADGFANWMREASNRPAQFDRAESKSLSQEGSSLPSESRSDSPSRSESAQDARDVESKGPKGEEVDVKDDHSDDNGPNLIRSRSLSNGRLIQSPTSATGKKEAQAYGIAQASHDIILCTDADVVVGPRWATTMARYLTTYGVDFLAGPTKMTDDSSLFLETFQSIEFSGIMLITAGGLKNKTISLISLRKKLKGKHHFYIYKKKTTNFVVFFVY